MLPSIRLTGKRLTEMNETIAIQLLKAREALKKKLGTLRSDIANAKRSIDIHYAPVVEPLKEIAMRLDGQVPSGTFKKSLGSDAEMEESYLPKKLRKPFLSTPSSQQQKRVGWFSPEIHSSPTKLERSKMVAESSKPKKPYSSLPQPSFLEDEYIGEYLPESSKSGKEASIEEEEEEEYDSSIDLAKSMAHAVSLLQSQPSRSSMGSKSINKTLLNTDVVKEALKNHHPLARPYLMGLMTDESDEFDNKYGIRVMEDDLKIGNADVEFEDEKIIIGKFKYRGTRGLYELLFKKKPGKFTYADAKNYKYILKDTNAHKVNYDATKKNAASRGFKYAEIIKPILEGKPPNVWWTRNWKTGLGLPTTNRLLGPVRKLSKTHRPNTAVEYKYWDDPNELCDRLKLLMASREAGHTGHNNEIIAITEELKEANIIG